MKICFRVDSSVDLGIGHTMRCLTLADELAVLGYSIQFISANYPGALTSLILDRGFQLDLIEPPTGPWIDDFERTAAVLAGQALPVDLLVVDSYDLDARWEKEIRLYARKILVIDDLANREHDCDFLLDQNYCKGFENRYQGLLPKGCQLLVGPSFALLRSQFLQAREESPLSGAQSQRPPQRFLVFLGGSDPTNETERILQAFAEMKRRVEHIYVIVGSSNPHRHSIEIRCQSMPNCSFHCQVDDMASFMTRVDLAIGAAGTVTWERCCVGLPSILCILADNQRPLAEAIDEFGAGINLGEASQIKISEYCAAIESVSPQQLHAMRQNALKLVDGRGCSRVAETIFSSLSNSRSVALDSPSQDLV